MSDCHVCGDTLDVPKRCNLCSEPVCEGHLLPESHNCLGLVTSGNDGKRFESDFPSENKTGDNSPSKVVSRKDAPSRRQARARNKSSNPTSDTSTDHSEVSPRDERLKAQTTQGGGSQDGSPPVRVNKKNKTEPAGHEWSTQSDEPNPVMVTLRIIYGKLWKWVPRGILAVGLVVVLINAGIIPASSVPGGETADVDLGGSEPIEGEMFPNASNESTENESDSSGILATEDFDRGKLEQAIHREVNEERANQSKRELRYRDDLRTVARGHSEDMAERGYFAHESPDGQNIEDRYAAAGIDCPTKGENIAQSWYKTNVRTDSGTEYYDTVDELASAIVDQWMNSPDHRENILRFDFSSQGIGVKAMDTDEGLKMYVTQNFCG